MKFKVAVDVMPLDELLDPQGKVVNRSMANLGISGIDQVRIGKHITFSIESNSKAEAEATVDEACKKLLANLIMERYSFVLTEVQ
ncbi:phosphoribosylformylglycinamidine synthase subunit PurS [bacterium]|nr:phosphoribosylformylglycinamidine synthase subunit PurS [bacterium]